MIYTSLNNFFVLLLLTIIIILTKIIQFYQTKDKRYIIIESEKNFYKEMLGLYFENKEKFYAKGREYKMSRIGNPFNQSNIITFQDKLNYLLIYEEPENKTKIVDKILLRNYSQEILGKDICNKILKIYNNVDEINLDELPDKFVIKCNHGSGMNIFCEDKSKFDLSREKYKLNEWMNINYGLQNFEYQYLNVERKIFAEKYLEKDIINYKFSCFNGEPKLIRVKTVINGTKIYNIYYTNWTISNIELDDEKYIVSNIFKKPINLEKMIEYSKLLSSKFCYCRVDFYEVNKTILLGEITFTPFNAQVKYKGNETQIYLGNLINISQIINSKRTKQ